MNSKHYGRVGAKRRNRYKKKGKTNECGDVLAALCRYGIVKKRGNVRNNALIFMQLVTVKEEKKGKKRKKTKTNATVSLLYYVTMVL